MSLATALIERCRIVARHGIPPRVFRLLAGTYERAACLRIAGWRGYRELQRVARPDSRGHYAQIRLPTLLHPITVRAGTTDVPTVIGAAVRQDLGHFLPSGKVRLIVDAGAYIGETAAWYLSAFREATVVALEPDADNFELLAVNCAPYGDRAIPMRAGIWPRDALLRVKPTADKNTVEVEEVGAPPYDCAGVSPLTLMRQTGAEWIDILKCNIEGAETDLFESDYEEWLSRTRSVFIQLHNERAQRAVSAAMERFGFRGRTFRYMHVYHRS